MLYPFKQPKYIHLFKRTLTSHIDKGKQLAAWKAVEDSINPNKHKVIGIGSGSTIRFAIERIAQKEDLRSLTLIPTSYQTKQWILDMNLRLGSIEECSNGIDITIDGADEVDKSLSCIKGGGGCLFQEKLVAQASDQFIIIADERKKSIELGTKWTQGIPIEVVPLAANSIQRILKNAYPQASIKLRMAHPSTFAGPTITENGNFLLDCHLGPLGSHPIDVYNHIKTLTGVLEVGLFCNMVNKAYFGNLDNSVDIWLK
ncbi:unnamed protein product [Cunninghamella blakesleeana]